ncbi:hypothetical protein [Myxococcus stipitatus]|uniref:hypothetical protein n=1 Tax=Myxococcus stipitatus TaxID=83455 RepID=UPI0030D5FBBF
MSRLALVRMFSLVVGVTLGGGWGCDVDPGDPGEDMPPVLSNRTCYSDDDCVPNACCGEGTAVTHVEDAPTCGIAPCSGECPDGTIDCGRCVPFCRGARCAAACR